MAAPTPYATAESAVYELVARGNKDQYFYADKKDSLFIFDNRYIIRCNKSHFFFIIEWIYFMFESVPFY